MAQVKFQKGSEEWLMFQDYYALCQRYWLPENAKTNKAYWQALVDDAGKFAEKYSHDSFGKRLALALLGYIGDKA